MDTSITCSLDEEVDPIEETSLQGRFTWKATENLTANLRLYYSDLEGGALNYITQIGDYNTGGFNFAGSIDADDTSIPYQANNIGENTREIFDATLKLDYETSIGTADGPLLHTISWKSFMSMTSFPIPVLTR